LAGKISSEIPNYNMKNPPHPQGTRRVLSPTYFLIFLLRMVFTRTTRTVLTTVIIAMAKLLSQREKEGLTAML
jgi:hypothetical protein